MSAETVLQILDDDNDGVADSEPLARLQSRSDSFVESYLRPIYNLAEVRATPPNEVVELSLDVAEMYCARRHAEYVRRNWREIREAVVADLESIRSGERRLDVVGSPEPAANNGGTVIESDARRDEDVARLWDFGATGDF